MTDANLGAAAAERLTKVADDVTWFSWTYPDRQARAEIFRQILAGPWDLCISFYSDLILPAAVLRLIRLPLNIHPALPTIRGVGHDVVPLVERHWTVGATLHRMEPILDSGEIYEVLEAPISPRHTYESLRAFNQSLCLEMLDRLCGRLAVSDAMDALEAALLASAANVAHRWGSYYSRADTNRLKEELRNSARP